MRITVYNFGNFYYKNKKAPTEQSVGAFIVKNQAFTTDAANPEPEERCFLVSGNLEPVARCSLVLANPVLMERWMHMKSLYQPR
jgi:hypothetical protein